MQNQKQSLEAVQLLEQVGAFIKSLKENKFMTVVNLFWEPMIRGLCTKEHTFDWTMELCFLTALGNLAEVYVEAIRSGNVPCLENAVVSLAKIQNVRAVEESLQFYMTEMLSMAQLPMHPEELSDIHKIAEKKAVEVFITMSFNDNDQIYQHELMVKYLLRTDQTKLRTNRETT